MNNEQLVFLRNYGLYCTAATSLHLPVSFEAPNRLWACTLNQSDIGAFSYVSPGSVLHSVVCGRYCSIGDNVQILSDHPTDRLSTHPFSYQNIFEDEWISKYLIPFANLKQTIIGNDVWIGSGAKIKSGIVIGDGAIIAAGAIITKNVLPYSIVGGVPAKIIRYRFDKNTVERLLDCKWWEYNMLELNIPFDKPEIALDTLESMKAEGLQKYIPRRKRLVQQGNLWQILEIT